MYLFRWQMSTPILAGVVWYLSDYNEIVSAVVANLIGGLIFYKIDKLIFNKKRNVKEINK
jgi:hypothetical protein